MEELNRRVQKDLELLQYPKNDWVKQRFCKEKAVTNVLVVGAGQSGLTLAFALKREFVSNIRVIDRNPPFQEGPWLSHGRMRTLLTPKDITGVDQGVPSLTFQSWYEAQYGEESYKQLFRIPRETWGNYLNWFRQQVNVEVENYTELKSMGYSEAEGLWWATLQTTNLTDNSKAIEQVWTRKIVFASGFDGLGKWNEMKEVIEAVGQENCSHVRRHIDFEKLRGKRVAVIGNGASGFDAAATALEQGALCVHLYGRRAKTHLTNLHWRWTRNVGFLKHHADCPDESKLKTISQLASISLFPLSSDSCRATAFESFHLHEDEAVGANYSHVQRNANTGKPEVVTRNGEKTEVDHIITATGLTIDLSLIPLFSTLVPSILHWRDLSEFHGRLPENFSTFPYLGDNFQLLAKDQVTSKGRGDDSPLNSIFMFSLVGLVNCGLGGCAVPGLKYGVERVCAGITRQLYIEDQDQHFLDLRALFSPEFQLDCTTDPVPSSAQTSKVRA